jgi:hypothetical protein
MLTIRNIFNHLVNQVTIISSIYLPLPC